MLSRPFRGLPKRRLVTLLILFLLLEAALGGGLYVNNRPASAAQPTSRPIYKGPGVLTVHNTPRTVILGQVETFSVQLKGLPRAELFYTVAYPDGRTDRFKVVTDATGFSKLRIPITFKPQHGKRDTIGISVSYGTTIEAATRFAVQLPDTKK